ncbi:60S ribosomal protein L21 [Balamuthia mandrillaris]
MPHSFGYRARTRHLFAQPFRRHGLPGLSRYLTTYKIGDYVDIKADASIHKGMPHKFYHGRTGIVWNVTKRAIGVEINKQVRNRIIKKRIHVRVEHVQKSRCREDFLKRVKANEQAKKAQKTAGVKLSLKRLPAQPKKGGIVKAKFSQVETVTPLKYELLV